MASSKIVLVTGGNGGLGYETVKALYESDKSYRILMGSRSLDKAKGAISKLQEECPGARNTVEAVQLDIASDESIEKACTQVQTDAGYVDVLVNNAGE
jgi:NAD(P)-dependent dehydrogenase (short-subunit alcohol dehydrogenase family)